MHIDGLATGNKNKTNTKIGSFCCSTKIVVKQLIMKIDYNIID